MQEIHVSNYVWLSFLLIVSLLIDTQVPPRVQPVYETATISYPYKSEEDTIVPSWLSIVLGAVMAPIMLALAFPTGRDSCVQHVRSRRFSEVLHVLLGIYEALILTLFFTTCAKKYAGRLRPCFIQMCDYNTTTGECSASRTRQWESRQSFPSGHSSSAFATFGFVTLYALGVLRNLRPPAWIPPLCLHLVSLLPLMLAGFISISRTVDYRHNYSDILAGAVLGLVVAYNCHNLHFKSRRHHYSLPMNSHATEVLTDSGSSNF